MFRIPFSIAIALCSPLLSSAQFDLGLALGTYGFSITPKHVAYIEQDYSASAGILPTVSLIYAERKATKGADFTLQLDYLYKAFHAELGESRHTSGDGRSVDLQLHLLYLTIAPDIYLDPGKQFAFRVGLQAGVLLAGYQQGFRWKYGYGTGTSYSERTELNGASDGVEGDLRVHIGLRVRPVIAGAQRFLLDGFANFAFTSMVRSEGASRGTDYGVRLGYVIRRTGKPLTGLMDEFRPN